MSARLAPYDINAIEASLSGIALKDGLVSIRVAMKSPAFQTEVGADGHTVRFATNDRRADIEVTLKGSSEEHAKLSALHGLDLSATNGAGVVPFFLRDGNGTSLLASDSAWIVQMPEKTFAASPGDVTWALEAVLASPLNAIIGGN